MKKIIFSICCFLPLMLWAQDRSVNRHPLGLDGNEANGNYITSQLPIENDSTGYSIVTVNPKFKGDETDVEFIKYLSNELKYPLECKENKIEGVVYVGFIIDTTGKVYNVKILSGVNILLDQEAIRVVQSSPDWEPGYIKGKPVRVKKVTRVRFKLNLTQDNKSNKQAVEKKDSLVYSFVPVKPKFQGDETDALFIKYVSNEIKYPLECKKNKIEGVVYVQFTIDTMGKVIDVKILRGVSVLLDQEALRVVQSSPDWEPAYTNGKPVRVNKVVPVRFKLN